MRIGVNMYTYGNWEAGENKPFDRYYPAIIEFLGEEPWDATATFADALRAERRRRGVSIKAAAADLGVDEGTWMRWERGEWKPKAKLAELINDWIDAVTP